MSSKQAFISFPPGYLGGQPAKFPLLANTDRLFALNKPAGVACFQHDWTLGKPDLSMALRRELLNGKPQLERLGLKGLFRVYNLDCELSGALLFAKDEANEELLKNAFGSEQLRFRFHLLAEVDGEERERFCDLPLARHFHEPRMVVSHTTGKKAETRLRFLRSFGQYELWEAETTLPRMHQARVHAAESGLRVVGEPLYSQGGEVYLSRLKRDYRGGRQGRERPIYEGLCIHLVEVAFALPELALDSVLAPLPSRFETLLKRLDEYRGRRG